MIMKKFINSQENLSRELHEGFAAANRDLVTLKPGNIIVNKKLESADRVTIVTLGGAGHEPALSGFVGEGMVDVSVVGDIFTAPGPKACIEAIKLADKGKGVLFIVLNHAGDMLTGDLTMKQAAEEGLKVVKVVTQEDVSNAPRYDSDNRRGLVGVVPAYKIAGAAAAEGKSLDEVAAITQKFVDNMATLAVAVRGATHPSTGIAFAELGDDEMEIGMGNHGEGGGGRQKMKSADETAEIMLNVLLKDLSVNPGEKLMLILNSVGATTLMELFILYRKCEQLLNAKNIEITANYIGELLTVQEQAGFQMFIARMDDELLRLWNAPCNTPYYKKLPTEGENKMSAEYMHIGIPVAEKKPGMSYVEPMKLWMSNPDDYEYKIEYLKFEEGTPFPEIMQKAPHVAYKVDDIEKHLENADQTIFPPTVIGPGTRIAFAVKDGAILEFYEQK